MTGFYQHICKAISEGKQLLAVLIDPDKARLQEIPAFLEKVHQSMATHLFVGGSTVDATATDLLVSEIKKHSHLPVVLFPGDVTQITHKADALLFLSLISGMNPEYLIGKHIEAIPYLKNGDLEVIPTGYVLIENGKSTAVERVTNTLPVPRKDPQRIADIAKAGELLGMKLIYLEAGSGALHPVPAEIISFVKKQLQIPLVVGGGIRSRQQLDAAYHAGADLVVIGTAFEKDDTFFNDLKPNL